MPTLALPLPRASSAAVEPVVWRDAVATDVRLMASAARDDETAFAALVARWAPRLHRFLVVGGSDRTDADDLVQETFIRAWQARTRYDPARPLSTWLFTIAVRLAANQRARQRPLPWREGLDPPAAELPGESGGIWDRARAVLEPRDFRLLWLHYGEDEPIDGLADVLGISANAAKVALHRARQRLAPFLAADHSAGVLP